MLSAGFHVKSGCKVKLVAQNASKCKKGYTSSLIRSVKHSVRYGFCIISE